MSVIQRADLNAGTGLGTGRRGSSPGSGTISPRGLRDIPGVDISSVNVNGNNYGRGYGGNGNGNGGVGGGNQGSGQGSAYGLSPSLPQVSPLTTTDGTPESSARMRTLAQSQSTVKK